MPVLVSNQHLYVRVVLLNIHTTFVIQHGPKDGMMHEGRLSKIPHISTSSITHKYKSIYLTDSSFTSSLINIIQHHFVINQHHMAILSYYFHRCIYTHFYINT